jgi:hypothetical protein
MPTFTPPTVLEVPPISVASDRNAPPTEVTNPAGYNLMRWYKSRPAGQNVYLMSDGTYRQTNQNEPWPATTPDLVANGELASSWYTASTTTHFPLPNPHVITVYYGGHSNPISSAEATALTAAGYGAYIT